MMSSMLLRAFVALGVLMVVGNVRAEEPAPAPWSFAVLLDRSADDEARARHLENLQAWAARGDRESRYVLGTLYRLGKSHPARLLKHDYQKAAGLLGHAALDGHVLAMAGLAELELEANRPLAGMMWAQAYVNFGEAAGLSGGDAYAGWLIHRLKESTRTLEAEDQDAVRETWAGFMQTYGERIADGLANGGRMRGASVELDSPAPPLRQEASGGGIVLGGIRSPRLDRGPKEPSFAVYVIGVGTDGKIEKAHVLDAAPEPRIATGMIRNLYTSRYNAVDADAPLRWTVLTMYFDDGSASLRR